jgi:phosphoglycerate dehydrogenase-like enzyme
VARFLSLIDDEERQSFFPGHLWDNVLEVFAEHRVVPPPRSGEEYARAILDYQAEVLLTGWSTPALPMDLLPGGLGPVKYLCHTAGTLRHRVPRKAIEQGLIVTNWGPAISRSVAECALMHILCSLRRTTRHQLALHRDRKWRDQVDDNNWGLFERRVGIHGFGNVARALIGLLRPFDVKISAWTEGVPDEMYRQAGITKANSIEELFAQSDVLVELEGWTPRTEHMVNERLLRLLPRGTSFVNVGRGKVVDEAALARVARERGLRLGLDVYEEEPLPADSPLRGMDDVTLTPHIGGPTIDRRKDAGSHALENLRCYARGETLASIMTPAVWDRST